MIIIYIGLFLLGASFASFLNATLYRIDKKYKYPEIIKLGSHCEKCKHKLKWWELIPILGYILIKGKCSKCKQYVNIYYPLSELFLGLVFLFFVLESVSWYLWVIVLFLFILSYFDITHKGIYKNLIHVFLAVSLLFFFLFFLDIYNIFLPLLFTLLILGLNIIKKSFGLGDVLVLLGLGILLNTSQYLVMFWLGILIALLYSLILVIKDCVDIKNTKIPMVPFFTLSFTITVLYGEQIYLYLLKLMGI
jgi:prepilin signal peptidase PulO-like enzyme (type II secretory pathway)